MGRPSKFTPAVIERICTELMQGRSLRKICQADDIPDQVNVFRHLHRDEEFRKQYALAREVQAETLIDEITDIADDGSNDWVERELKDGSTIVVADHEHINRSRLRVDTRKWVASKILAKKYGDRVVLEDGPPRGLEFGNLPMPAVEPGTAGKPN